MTNSSEVNKIGKSLTSQGWFTGTLRGECSVMNPTVQLSGFSASDVDDVNYMYIEDFGRFYFVNDIRSIRNGLWEISGHVDVLETYSTQILANSAIIQRQENRYNLYLDDGQFKAYANPQVVIKKFPSGFSSNGNYLLLVVGG